MDFLMHDIRYALRTLSKSIGFTAIAVLCLALGIGINSTIYSAVHAMLVRALPFTEPDRLVALHETFEKQGIDDNELSFPNLIDMRDENTVFDGVATWTDRFVNYEELSSTPDQPRSEGIEVALVTPNMFSLLGVAPILGRDFRPEEGEPGAPAVVMIGHEFWESRYDGDPDVVGHTVRLNGTPTTIIGIMPRRFGWFDTEQLWQPLVYDPAKEARGSHYLDAIARLRPGVTLGQANANVRAIAARLTERYPATNSGVGARVVALRETLLPGDVRLVMLVMMGAVGFVLLIACANVANLLLARASARQKEIAIRTALGAGRGRIIRQLLTESVIIGLVGGSLGILFAIWGVDLIFSQIPERLPDWMHIHVDSGVVIFTVAVSVLTGIVFGLAPALQASKPNLNETLKEGGRGTTSGTRRNRLRSMLVVAEVALSLVLLIGASLMMQSFLRLRNVSPGFRTDSLLTARLYLSADRYPEDQQRRAFFDDAMRRLAQLPGAASVAAVNYVPLSGSNTGSSFVIEGQDVQLGEEPMASWRPVTADYFRTLGMTLVRGRPFTASEAADTARVVIINQAMAERFWPNEDPLGKRMSSGGGASDRRWLTVVGVAPTVKLRELDGSVDYQFYMPYGLNPWRTMSLLVRTTGDPASFAPTLRRGLAELDPALPLFDVATMEQVAMLSYWDKRLYGLLFTSFAAIALVLASVGVYGVLSYAVSQRTHEIGVRVAMGAQLRDVLTLVVRHGMILTAIGVVIGVAGAFGLTRMLSGVLYGVSASDPMTYVSITAMLLSVALLASYIPARRATKVDPMVALRYE